MPITAFPGFDDGLEAGSRRRDHFIADLALDSDRLWIPYGETAWFRSVTSTSRPVASRLS